MADKIELAKAYVQIIPTTKGIQDNLTTELGGVGTSAGKSAGGKFASAFSAGIKGTAAVTAAVAGVVAAGSAAVVSATSQLAQYGDEIDKTSQKLGVSSSFYQEWDAVLQHSGTSMESMTTTFRTLANASQDATKDQIASFEALGLSMDEVSQLSTEDLFEKVIAGLQGMEEGTQRTAIATDLLGRGAMEMGALLNTSAEDTQAMIDTVNELGGVLDETAVKNAAAFQDNLQDMQTAFNGLKNNLLAEFLPGINEVMQGLTAFISGDESGLQGISEGIQNTISKIGQNLPELLDVAVNIVEGIADAIIQNLPELVNAAIELIGELGGYIIENLPLLLESALAIIEELAEGLTESLPEIVPAIISVLLQIVDTLIENLDMLIDCAIDIILALADGIVAAAPLIMEKAPEIIIKLIDAIVENAPKLIESALVLMMTLGEGMIKSVPALIKRIPEIIKSIIDGFGQYYKNMEEVGINLLAGLWDGISSKTQWIKDQITALGDSILQNIKDIFGIASPSKEMAWVGQMLDEGLAGGISDYSQDVLNEARGLNSDLITEMAGVDAELTRQISADYSLNGEPAGGTTSTGTDLGALLGMLQTYLPRIADKEIMLDGRAISETVWKESRKEYKATGTSPVIA